MALDSTRKPHSHPGKILSHHTPRLISHVTLLEKNNHGR